jgi:hypothetical protein
MAKENHMARKKQSRTTVPGRSLLGRGDIITIMEDGSPLECKVLSCITIEDGACLASLEILEGERKGERITTKLRAGGEKKADE